MERLSCIEAESCLLRVRVEMLLVGQFQLDEGGL